MPIHKIEKRHTTVTTEDWDCSGRAFCMDHGPFPSEWRIYSHELREEGGKVYATWGRYTKPYHIETKRVEVPRPTATETPK